MMTQACAGAELKELCETVRAYSDLQDFEACVSLIAHAMEEHPSAPEPHNLLGIVLEREGRHAEAMRHFRAAYALDPSYRPARQNLEHYGTFYAPGGCAFDQVDCPEERDPGYEITYDTHGIGHVQRRKKL